MTRLIPILIVFFTIISGCGEYSRGDRFKADFGDDSLLYVVAAKGYGEKISEMALQMKDQHEARGNSCVITYLTDSAALNDKKGLLLLNSTLPHIEDDLLTKGFFGQFTSKQIVSYILVSAEDVNKYLIKME
jgi:hypothetical protein